MSEELNRVMERCQTHIATEMDAQILAFFGSVEAVREFGYLYIIETETLPLTTTMDDMTYTIHMEQRQRIRLKTKEELGETV